MAKILVAWQRPWGRGQSVRGVAKAVGAMPSRGGVVKA